MVIDLDRNHKPGVDGVATAENMYPGISTADTLRVITPSGGLHLYFKYREGLANSSDYFPGVDVRTDNGVITMPETERTPKDGKAGGIYKVEHDAPIGDIPDGFFDLLLGTLEKKKPNRIQRIKSDKDGILPGSQAYSKGSRNNTLLSAVSKIITRSSIRNWKDIYQIAQGLNLVNCADPLPDDEVLAIAKSVGKMVNPEYCKPDGKVIQSKLIDYMTEKTPVYSRGNIVFMYSAEDGYYKPMEAIQIQNLYLNSVVSDEDKTAAKARSFSDLFIMSAYEKEQRSDEKRLICCGNGIFNLDTQTVEPYSPEKRLEVKFKPNYREIPEEEFKNSLFCYYLDSTLDKETQKMVQEMLGLLLSPHAFEVQRAFFLKGEGSDGKSVLTQIMTAIFEDELNSVSSIGLGDFSGQFDIAQAEGKHANIVPDDQLTGVQVGGKFKSMTCGESVSVNRKGKDIQTLSFNMTYIFGLNRLPSTIDKSHGFYRRPAIIPFNIRFGTEEEVRAGTANKVADRKLSADIIKNELDIVFYWAVQGLIRLKSNNWKLTESEASIKEMRDFKCQTDSVYSFFEEHVNTNPANPNNIISKKELYQSYCEYCIENGYQERFITKMIPFGRQITAFGVKEDRNSTFRYWYGIELINDNKWDEELARGLADGSIIQNDDGSYKKVIKEEPKHNPEPIFYGSTWGEF